MSTFQPVFKTLWVHVTLSMLGTVGFAVAFVAGLMYLIQDGLLKSKRFNVLYTKLPALDYLDHLNQQAIDPGLSPADAWESSPGPSRPKSFGVPM